MNAFAILNERGFFYQLTDDQAIRDQLLRKRVPFYIGIDPTADSLHVGHLLPLMACRWLQLCGHRPLILIGGGTAMVGDPSGKTDLRQMLTKEEIAVNAQALQSQIEYLFRSTSQPTAGAESRSNPCILNNRDWLQDLRYIDFLRDFGRHFSVNKMLAADSVKLRLETGLSFLEFNYMLLQSYDFYVLARDYNCTLQLGGQDQWGNIVAGVDLVRRLLGRTVYGATFPLLTDRHDRKFGKTVAGAIWLDARKTSVFDYYQFWRNTDDHEVGKLLAFYSMLPIDEVTRLGSLTDTNINRAKEILAYEATALAHGAEAARDAYLAAGGRFGYADPDNSIATTSDIAKINIQSAAELPTAIVAEREVDAGLWIVNLLVNCGLEKSNGAARRLIQGGGAYVNDQRVADINMTLTMDHFQNGELIVRSGKKKIRRVVIGDQ